MHPVNNTGAATQSKLSNWYSLSAVTIAVGVMALLVFASMHLAGTLPSSLNGSTFSYIALGLGAAWFVKNIYAERVDPDNTKWDLLPPLVIIALAVCSLFPHVIDIEQLSIGTVTVTGLIVMTQIIAFSNKWGVSNGIPAGEQYMAQEVGKHFGKAYEAFKERYTTNASHDEKTILLAFLQQTYPLGHTVANTGAAHDPNLRHLEAEAAADAADAADPPSVQGDDGSQDGDADASDSVPSSS